jgi:hypothetical protein
VECTACDWSCDNVPVEKLIPEPQGCTQCRRKVKADDEGQLIHWHSGSAFCYGTPAELADLELEIERLRSSRAAVSE